MTNFLISDLHLEEDRPEITALFLNFLQTAISEAAALYILGDLFEVWVGDDNQTDFNLKIIQAFHQATAAGLPIFILHGNRDFLLGKKFFRQTGCQFLPDETIIHFNETPTLLMHGDTLCTEDEAYLKFRKKARNVFYQQLFLFKSLKKRKQIAIDIREKSKQHTSTSSEYIMDVTQTEVERVMQKHQVLHLIHGHTHREAIHQFSCNEKSATRIVLGAWHTQGSVLVWDTMGQYELMVVK